MPTRSWRSGSPTSALDGDPSTPAGLLAALADASRSSRAAPRYFVRLWTPVAKVVNRVRGNGRVAPAGPPRDRRSRDRERAGRRAGPSTDGGRAGRAGRVRGHGGDPRARRRDAAPARIPEPTRSRSSRRTSLRSRSASGCASRGRSCRSSSRSAIIAFFLYLNRDRLAQVPTLILQANPALVLLAVRGLLSRVPAARLPLAAPAARDRLHHRPAQLDRDPVHLVVRQLRRPGQARRRVPGLPAQDEQRCVAQPDVRHGLHRTHPGHLRDRDPRPRGRLLELPRRDARRPSGSCSSSASWSSSSPAVGLFTMRNFGRRILLSPAAAATVLELYERFEEGVFGAVGLRHLPILVVITGLIWLTEGLRLYIVVLSFGFSDVEIGLSGAIFVALIGSLLTAIPLSPAGLGFAQAGVIGVLTVVYKVPLRRGDGDHDPRLGHQRPVDHRVRGGPVRRLADAARDGQDPAAAGAHDGRPGGLKRRFRPVRARSIQPEPPDVPLVRGRCQSMPSPDRRIPHRTRPVARAGLACRWYQRVIQVPDVPTDSWPIGPFITNDPTERPGTYDDPERPSVQRMASSAAQGQEDVPAAARPAVRRRSLDDLAADPGRSHAVARDRHEAGSRSARAA